MDFSKIVPTKEHKWLQQLIGTWTFEYEMPGDEGKTVAVSGTETFRSIGEWWVQGESRSKTPDGKESVSVMTLGFDPLKGRFVGSWLGSMMPNLWVYDGELEGNGRVLSLYSEGPSMDGSGSLAPYKDVIEIVSATHRTLSGHSKDADGTWQPFMKVEYRKA